MTTMNLIATFFLVALTVVVAVTITVNVYQPAVPTAEEISAEMIRQMDQRSQEQRQTAQERKNAMRCGLPGYEACR